jgi:hypothetical protein
MDFRQDIFGFGFPFQLGPFAILMMFKAPSAEEAENGQQADCTYERHQKSKEAEIIMLP